MLLNKKVLPTLTLILILIFFTYYGNKVFPYSFINPEVYESLNILDKDLLNKGTLEVKKHKVLILGISRDNRKQLKAVIKNIEYTGKQFADYKVIIFENDSTDNTKIMLKLWSLLNDKVIIISENFNLKKRPSIKFLADIRNKYINYIQDKFNDFDIVMILDMDMKHGWDIRGIYDSFAKIDIWQAVCAMGIEPNGVMGDAFAFRNREFPNNSMYPLYWQETVVQIKKKYNVPVNSPFIPVDSCFNGLAFYKRNFIQNCKYDSLNEDCEHVAFHNCIVYKNRGKMYMNPAMVIRYDSRE